MDNGTGCEVWCEKPLERSARCFGSGPSEEIAANRAQPVLVKGVHCGQQRDDGQESPKTESPAIDPDEHCGCNSAAMMPAAGQVADAYRIQIVPLSSHAYMPGCSTTAAAAESSSSSRKRDLKK